MHLDGPAAEVDLAEVRQSVSPGDQRSQPGRIPEQLVERHADEIWASELKIKGIRGHESCGIQEHPITGVLEPTDARERKLEAAKVGHGWENGQTGSFCFAPLSIQDVFPAEADELGASGYRQFPDANTAGMSLSGACELAPFAPAEALAHQLNGGRGVGGKDDGIRVQVRVEMRQDELPDDLDPLLGGGRTVWTRYELAYISDRKGQQRLQSLCLLGLTLEIPVHGSKL